MGKTWERSLVLIKPDGVKRALVGAIISRFENVGLTVTGIKLIWPELSRAEKHCESHRGKSFFEGLVGLLTSGPVVALVLEGAHAISVVRKLVGATEPREAMPGTIRGDYCHMSYERSRERLGVIPNLIHASENSVSAAAEIAVWFAENEIVEGYSRFDEGVM